MMRLIHMIVFLAPIYSWNSYNFGAADVAIELPAKPSIGARRNPLKKFSNKKHCTYQVKHKGIEVVVHLSYEENSTSPSTINALVSKFSVAQSMSRGQEAVLVKVSSTFMDGFEKGVALAKVKGTSLATTSVAARRGGRLVFVWISGTQGKVDPDIVLRIVRSVSLKRRAGS